MVGEASSSGHSCFNGSNALSHVYIQYPPLRGHVPETRSLFYDDGNKLILSLTSNQVMINKACSHDGVLVLFQLNIMSYAGLFMEDCSI